MKQQGFRRRHLLALPLALLLLTGAGQCSFGGRDFGGGGGSSDTTQTTIAPVATFGSVFVAGTEHGTSGASITVDGVSAGELALHPGEVATLSGTVSSDGQTGTATSLAVNHKLVGPVSAVDPGAGNFTVLGQTVYVTADTSVGPGFQVADVAGFSVGTVLVIDGYRTSTGIVASRIDLATGQALRVAGRVANLSGFAQTFTLNGTTVDFSAVSGGLPPLLTNGSYVVASGGTASGATTLKANVLTLLTESPTGAGGTNGLVHGAITRFGSSGDFDVAGQPVTTSGLTTVTNGALTDLALDGELEVTGQYTNAGALTATRLDLVPAVPFRVVGPVQAINTSAGTLEIAGITLATDRRTRWDDQSPPAIKLFGVSSLAVGDWVEVRGLASGPLAAGARLVERRVAPTPAYVELQDVPTALADPSLTLTGIGVDTSTASFADASGQSLSHSAFFAAAPGRTIRVTGAFIGGTLTAATVSLRPL